MPLFVDGSGAGPEVTEDPHQDPGSFSCRCLGGRSVLALRHPEEGAPVRRGARRSPSASFFPFKREAGRRRRDLPAGQRALDGDRFGRDDRGGGPGDGSGSGVFLDPDREEGCAGQDRVCSLSRCSAEPVTVC